MPPHDAPGHDQGTASASQGVRVGTSVHPDLPRHTSHYLTPSSVPILSFEMSATHTMQASVNAPSGSEHIPEHASGHVPGDAEATATGDVLAVFPGSSRITSTGTLPVTLVVIEDFVPIKIEKVPGTLKCFNYYSI